MSGCFVTFEGIEGSGKTTQLLRLAEHLRTRGLNVVTTREPGGTVISEQIRAVLLDPSHTAMGVTTELLLYAAARAQHVHELILPALESGSIVLCDRFADSTLAYQGAGRELDPAMLSQFNEIATGGLLPSRTYLLDLPVGAGLQRARERGRMDRMEAQAREFHERVRAGFLTLAREQPQRIVVLDAAQEISVLASEVLEDFSQTFEAAPPMQKLHS